MERWLKVGEGIKDRLSKRLSPLRIELSHGQIMAYSALALILFVAFIIRILPLRWENLSSGVTTLNEFDPYYQFSVTQYMVNHGLLSPFWPTHWINHQLWYPFGLDMSTALPSIPITGAAVYDVITAFGANVNLMTLCAMIPPVVGVLSSSGNVFLRQGHWWKNGWFIICVILGFSTVNHRKNISWIL